MCFPFLLLLNGCSKESKSHTGQGRWPVQAENFQPRPYTGKLEPDDGQWTRAAKDYASTRYSSLDQINRDTVKQLKVAFTFDNGIKRGQEAAPIVVNNTMYLVTPWPNVLYALDLTKPGAPVKWSFDPKPEEQSKGVACCDVVNRGAVYSAGKIIYNTLDGNTLALDAATGKLLWKTKLADIQKGETITMAPLVVKDKVLVGNSGGEFGVRGWLIALNVNTGKIAWRAYTTGPDADVLIGPRFKPFYSQYRGKDLGVKSWPPDAWKIGGGSVWGWISYDPELNLVYYGAANPGPWNAELRPGDNLWTDGIFARDADTGEAIWFYQLNPHDLFDHDGVNENILLDLPINGHMRKVLVKPDRNGNMYVIDRTNGEVLTAEPFVFINSNNGVDLKTGLLQMVEEKKPRFGTVVRQICPTAPGGKDWQPAAFSPRTGLLYVPHQNICMNEEGTDANYIAGTPYLGAIVTMMNGPGGHGGEFSAWDPISGKYVWKIKHKFPFWSGALATAGDVVFFGTLDGYFKAVDAYTGNELWSYKTESGIIGQPIAYRGPDGKEYVAIMSGVGGWAGALVSGGLDARDSSAALGMVSATKGLNEATQKGSKLYVFALP